MKQPVYVARQKEQQRLSRVAENRAARRGRKYSNRPSPDDAETDGAADGADLAGNLADELDGDAPEREPGAD